MLVLIPWEIWKERNNCVFRAKLPSSDDVIHAIHSDIDQWRLAGAVCLEAPFGDPVIR
jgi:hypothetical protein